MSHKLRVELQGADFTRSELRSMARESARLVDFGQEVTKQEFKEECDVNTIVRRFVRDGFLSHVARGQPQYVDVSDLSDYRTAIEQVRAASEFFAGLPAKVRARFGNDPARYLDEAGSLSRDELRELGLAEVRADDRQGKRRSTDVVEPAPDGEAGSGTVSS